MRRTMGAISDCEAVALQGSFPREHDPHSGIVLLRD